MAVTTELLDFWTIAASVFGFLLFDKIIQNRKTILD